MPRAVMIGTHSMTGATAPKAALSGGICRAFIDHSKQLYAKPGKECGSPFSRLLDVVCARHDGMSYLASREQRATALPSPSERHGRTRPSRLRAPGTTAFSGPLKGLRSR